MKLELANYSDIIMVERGHAAPSEVRRFEVEGFVDTGAAQLVIPAIAMNALGLEESWQAKVKYADGHTGISRPFVKNVWLRLCNRESVFSAIVEPGRDTALIGAIVLEALDLVGDCVTQTLHPRDPQQILADIDNIRGVTVHGTPGLTSSILAVVRYRSNTSGHALRSPPRRTNLVLFLWQHSHLDCRLPITAHVAAFVRSV